MQQALKRQAPCRVSWPTVLAPSRARMSMITFARGGNAKKRPQQLSVAPAPAVSSNETGRSTELPSTSSGQLPQQAQVQLQQVPSTSPASSSAAVTNAAQPNVVKVVWRRLVRELSSLPRAIGIMAVVTGLSALGTVIPQNKGLEYYMNNYPVEGDKVLGFLDYNILLILQLDHIYSAWYFYASIALLGASLMACTYTTQLPTAKVAQRWRFANTLPALKRHGETQVLPNAHIPDLGKTLTAKSYQVFLKEGQLYAFKGLSGRLGPIGVHVALLLCLFGTAYSGFGGWKGSAMCPEGQEFVVGQAITPASLLASPPSGAETVLQVNKFSIDTRPDGSVAQFYSDLTLRDFNGKTLQHKTISVNDPLRWGGVTMYQTDWSLAALTLRLVDQSGTSSETAAAAASSSLTERTGQLLDQLQADAQGNYPAAGPGSSSSSSGSSSDRKPNGGLPQRAFSLPLASLEGRPGVPNNAKLYATFLPLELPPEDGRPPRGISMLARDLETVTFYDSKGEFVGVRRAGSGKPIQVEGLGIILDNIVGSTGLEIKSDPGVPVVYAGFGALMITTLISYISHSQVWAFQEGANVYVAGRSNRSKVLFEQELNDALDAVPETLPAAPAAPAVAAVAAAK